MLQLLISSNLKNLAFTADLLIVYRSLWSSEEMILMLKKKQKSLMCALHMFEITV